MASDRKLPQQPLINLKVARKSQPPAAYFLKASKDQDASHLISSYLGCNDTVKLSRICITSYSIFQKDIAKAAVQELLQAVIDDDRNKVTRLLDGNPELVLAIPQHNLVIESKYTWQKFYAEDALTMAVKRKQIKMIEILLPYFDRLEQTNEVIRKKTEALSKWSFYEESKEEIVIPPEHKNYIQSLIDIFSKEDFPNSDADNIRFGDKLSEDTEAALSFFRNNLSLPKHTVKLDDYFDVELLLYAAYKAYVDNFNQFQNWKQRNFFCIKIIGFLQSLVTPETGKIYCQGLYDVVEENKEIGALAKSLKLLGGESFYRPSMDSSGGLGFEFMAGRRAAWAPACVAGRVWPGAVDWKNYIEQKQQIFGTYAAAISTTAKSTLGRP